MKIYEWLLQYLGMDENSARYNAFRIEGNKIRPKGTYEMGKLDPWCAFTQSIAAVKTGNGSRYPWSVNCDDMINKAKTMGTWVEDESVVPEPDWWILYDWQDTGKGDDKGNTEHIGDVWKVVNGIIFAIEGNYNNKVGIRQIAVNSRYIRGFIKPKGSPSGSTTIKALAKKPNKPINQPAKNPTVLKKCYFTADQVGKLQTECNNQGFSNQKVDKKPGPITLKGCPLVKFGAEGNITKLIQTLVGVKADGIYGKDTKAAVAKWQDAFSYSQEFCISKTGVDKIYFDKYVFVLSKILYQ
jgi:hypothetical protein